MLKRTQRQRWNRSKLEQSQKLGSPISSKRPLGHGGVWSCISLVNQSANEVSDIDLTALIPQLDTVASDLVAHQRDTLTQRKELAQKTKDFRKLDDESKLNDIKGLLKCEYMVMPMSKL